MEWFRWYGGTFNDPKLQWVANKSCQTVASVLAVWVSVLERAHDSEPRGCCAGLDFESLDVSLGLEDGSTHEIYQAMVRKLMIVDGDMVANWEKRQPKSEDIGAAERKRNQREREKLNKEIEDLRNQLNVTLSQNVTGVTVCHGMSQNVTTEERRLEEKREEEPLKPKVKSMHACGATELRLRNYFDEQRDYLTDLFPDFNLDLEKEELVAKYRSQTIGADVGLLVIRWMRGLENKPKGVLSENQNIRGRPITFAESGSIANQEASQNVLRRLLDANEKAGGYREAGDAGFQTGGIPGSGLIGYSPSSHAGGVG